MESGREFCTPRKTTGAMALLLICAGLCSSTEGLCEHCQHCKTTASLEGEGDDVQTSSRGLCAISMPKALGMLLLPFYLSCAPTSGSRTTRGLQAHSPAPPQSVCQLPSERTFALSLENQRLEHLPFSPHNVVSFHHPTAKALWTERETQCWS